MVTTLPLQASAGGVQLPHKSRPGSAAAVPRPEPSSTTLTWLRRPHNRGKLTPSRESARKQTSNPSSLQQKHRGPPGFKTGSAAYTSSHGFALTGFTQRLRSAACILCPSLTSVAVLVQTSELNTRGHRTPPNIQRCFNGLQPYWGDAAPGFTYSRCHCRQAAPSV